MRAVEKRRASKLRSRKWRLANPESARAACVRSRARHPLTPEQRARKAETNREWRRKNAAKIKRQQVKRWAETSAEKNARRRAKYAADPARHVARMAAWKAAHPGHNRAFYHRHREKFTGNGPWTKRAKRLKRAWRKFVHTGASCRADNQQGR